MDLKKLNLASMILAVTVLVPVNLMAAPGDQLTISSVVNWAVDQMVVWSPPGKSMYPNAKETESEGLTRYASIAEDALKIAFDPSEPPLFKGDQARYKTFALLLSVADSESGYRKDVDIGHGAASKGDSGQSWCLEQVRLGVATNGKTSTRIRLIPGGGIEYTGDKSAYGGEDLVSDRKKCFRVALHIMRMSFDQCKDQPIEGKLSMYTSGFCDRGYDASARRVKKAIKWLNSNPPPSNDEYLMSILK